MPPEGQVTPAASTSTQLDRVRVDGSQVRFELRGDGVAGWTARFVQEPQRQTTNEKVSITGTCVLQVDLSTIESDTTYDRTTSDTAFTEIVRYPVGENGIAQTFIGTRSGTAKVTVENSSDGAGITVSAS